MMPTDIRRIANHYMRSRNAAIIPESVPYARVNESRARAIASAYDALPVKDTSIECCAAYRRLASEVREQFRLLLWNGLRFDPFGDDWNPYPNGSCDVFKDIESNSHLWVYAGGADHPGLTRNENWQFRAVHDVFGHYMNGYQFGPRGEENAWRCHSLMFGPVAVKALTTETRGQNSWVNFGPHASLPASQRPYAVQKAAILPAFAFVVD